MMMLTLKMGDLSKQYKMFHFEYVVLLELLNLVSDHPSTNKVIARDLCLYGIISVDDIEFKLERVA